MFCPNCSAELSSAVTRCWNCDAVFNENAAWRPTDRPQGAFRQRASAKKALDSAAAESGITQIATRSRSGIYSFISFISGLLGLIVGVLCWLMVSLLFKGVGPWGGGGAMGALMLFGPFAVLVPCIIRLADRGAMVGMIWMVALSPVISMTLSFVVFAIAVSALSPTSSESKDMAFGIVGAVATTTWVLIGLYLIKSGWAYRDEPEDEHLAS